MNEIASPTLHAMCFLKVVWPFSSALNAGLSSKSKFWLMFVLGRFLKFIDEEG